MIELWLKEEQGTGLRGKRSSEASVTKGFFPVALKESVNFSSTDSPGQQEAGSYELTLVYKFWLSDHIVTVTVSYCGFGSEIFRWHGTKLHRGAHIFQRWVVS